MEHESKGMLEKAGIPTTGCEVAKSREDAVGIAENLGFPVVMKILSPEIVHKSDIGGVKVNIDSEEGVRKAYDEIMDSVRNHAKEIVGVSVQKMADRGVEIIVGMTKDSQFGPALMFGIGGVLVEVLKDVSFRIIPIEERDAHEMIGEIKAYPILEGYRGSPPANIEKIKELLLNVSDFISNHPEIEEMDLNPVFASEDGVVVADARIITE
jgi:acyl-CoA synthetase (NDP forming)